MTDKLISKVDQARESLGLRWAQQTGATRTPRGVGAFKEAVRAHHRSPTVGYSTEWARAYILGWLFGAEQETV